LGELVNDMTNGELKLFEEKISTALSDLHKTVEICHKDIKADNILLLPPHTSRSDGFVIIDLSEGIIRKDTSDAIWKKACKEDIQALREIFKDARSVKVGGRNSFNITGSQSDLVDPCRQSWLVASLFKMQYLSPYP